MRAYSVQGPNTSGTSATMVGVTGSTSVRPVVYELVVGSNATPADQAYRVTITRYTAAGTATSYTPIALDSADVAAVATAGITHTVEPTYTASSNLLDYGMNLKSTMRWVAVPGYEFKGPATAANGLGARIIGATASLVSNATMFWFE